MKRWGRRGTKTDAPLLFPLILIFFTICFAADLFLAVEGEEGILSGGSISYSTVSLLIAWKALNIRLLSFGFFLFLFVVLFA